MYDPKGVVLVGFVLGLAGAFSCGDNVSKEDETCYPADPWVDYDGHPLERAFCDYGALPEFEELPDNISADSWSFCFELQPGEVCDGCPAEETNERIIDAFVEARECQEPIVDNIGGCAHRTAGGEICCTSADCEEVVHDFIRGCFATADDGKTCCYSAVIASPCIGSIIQ